jgi:hypothetical protein
VRWRAELIETASAIRFLASTGACEWESPMYSLQSPNADANEIVESHQKSLHSMAKENGSVK